MKSVNLSNEIIKIVSKMFGVKENEISDESSPQTIENWDSLNHLILISQIEKFCGIKFKVEEIMGIKNIGDIKEAIRKHGIET